MFVFTNIGSTSRRIASRPAVEMRSGSGGSQEADLFKFSDPQRRTLLFATRSLTFRASGTRNSSSQARPFTRKNSAQYYKAFLALNSFLKANDLAFLFSFCIYSQVSSKWWSTVYSSFHTDLGALPVAEIRGHLSTFCCHYRGEYMQICSF